MERERERERLFHFYVMSLCMYILSILGAKMSVQMNKGLSNLSKLVSQNTS